MVRKVCPYCGKDSYSSAELPKWICPYCQKDITHIPVRPLHAEPGENEKYK